MTSTLAIITLGILASVSPLLTLLSLWQTKEWRFDRLNDHLRREGTVRQLFGLARPAVLGIWIVLLGLSLAVPAIPVRLTSPSLPLAALALLGAVQIIFRRQRFPHWTSKAQAFLIVSLIADTILLALIMVFSGWQILAPLVPFAQAFTVTIAWFVLRPLDRILKTRILLKAEILRAQRTDLTVIGITGSAGKTTTKELLSHILAGESTFTTPAHVNTEMGVAAWMTTILSRQPANAILIVEMGAYRKGEISLLCSITKPRIGIITSIGEQHIGLFGSREAITNAKGELFRSLPSDGGQAFLNADSPMAENLRGMCLCPSTTVSTGGNADLQAFDIEETRAGIRFTCEGVTFDIPINGTHNVTNALLAIACARHLNRPMAIIAQRLRTFRGLQHTFELKSEKGITILDDTYNSSPQSFEAAIEWARRQPEKRKVLLTSGIIELGGQEAEIHGRLAALARDVFRKAYVTNPAFLEYFRTGGFGGDAYPLDEHTRRLEPGSLLVCIGRMPKSAIDRMLPEPQISGEPNN